MKHGFTLIEMMVSVSLFVVVALVVTASLINISIVNRENAAVKLALENMGLFFDTIGPAIESKPRNQEFICNPCGLNQNNSVLQIPSSSGSIKYIFRRSSVGSRTFIEYSDNGGATFFPLTNPDITITKLRFVVFGGSTIPYDRVLVYVEGQVRVKSSFRTFALQSQYYGPGY